MDWGQKRSQSNKINLRVFCEKLFLDSLFSNVFQVFSMRFLYVLKMYHVRLFIVEKMEFGMAPRRCEIHSKPQSLLQKTCLFHASETLAAYAGMCLHTHAFPMYACLAHVRRSLPKYVGQGPHWSFISKIDFCLVKMLYFSF